MKPNKKRYLKYSTFFHERTPAYSSPPSFYGAMSASVKSFIFPHSCKDLHTVPLLSRALSVPVGNTEGKTACHSHTSSHTARGYPVRETAISVVVLRMYFQESGFLCVPNVVLRSFTSWRCTSPLELLQLFAVLEGGVLVVVWGVFLFFKSVLTSAFWLLSQELVQVL